MLLHAKFLRLLFLSRSLFPSMSLFYRKLFLLLLSAALFSCFLDIHTRLLSLSLSLLLSTGFNTTPFFWCLFNSKRHFLLHFSSVEIATLASTPHSDSRYRSANERESFFVHIFAAPLCPSESVRCLDDHSHPKNLRSLTFLFLLPPLPPPPASSFLLSSPTFLPQTPSVVSFVL